MTEEVEFYRRANITPQALAQLRRELATAQAERDNETKWAAEYHTEAERLRETVEAIAAAHKKDLAELEAARAELAALKQQAETDYTEKGDE